MTLIGVAVRIIVCGVLLYLAETFIPMDAAIRKVLRAVVVIVLVLWLLSVFGLMEPFWTIPVPRVR